MEQPSDAASARRPPPLFAVGASAVLLALAFAGWLLVADAAHVAPSSASSIPLLLVIGFTLVALAALAGWLAAGSLTRWRMSERLRDARAETQALTQLLDVWHWRTDPRN